MMMTNSDRESGDHDDDDDDEDEDDDDGDDGNDDDIQRVFQELRRCIFGGV